MERIAIIGAGLSGLVTLKSVLETGHEAKVFERESTCGGLWRYQPPSEECPGYVKVQTEDGFVYPLYESVKTNTAAYSTYFSDFHLEKSRGYLRHSEVFDYLSAYADNFKLHAHIQYNSNVKRLDKYDCQWQVTYEQNGQTQIETFHKVLIASGMFRYPRTPSIENAYSFQGNFLHSSQVKNEKDLFSDKRVLIIGGGHSGGELAYYALKANASHVFLIQSSNSSKTALLWNRLVQSENGLIEWDYQMTYENCIEADSFFGVIKQNSKSIDGDVIGQSPGIHGVVRCILDSKEFLTDQINSGKLTVVKSTVSQFDKTDVLLDDGSLLPSIDIVVAATGFKYNFPFLAHLLDCEKPLTLYRRMLPVEKCLDGLAFVLVTRARLTAPLAEMQARWLCQEFLPRQYCEKGLLYTDVRRQSMEQDIAKLIESMGDSWPYLYNSDKNPYKTVHELASEINSHPPEHTVLLESSSLHDVELGVALYHGPMTALRYRIAGDRSTPQREHQIISFAKDVMGDQFHRFVDKYMNTKL